jgi:ribosome biogenesis GTPase A
LRARYKLTDLPATGADLLRAVGEKRGCLVKGGEVDLTKAAGILLNELRAGQIGRISLQKPPE